VRFAFPPKPMWAAAGIRPGARFQSTSTLTSYENPGKVISAQSIRMVISLSEDKLMLPSKKNVAVRLGRCVWLVLVCPTLPRMLPREKNQPNRLPDSPVAVCEFPKKSSFAIVVDDSAKVAQKHRDALNKWPRSGQAKGFDTPALRPAVR